ncbi:hypothetical protein LCGC14_1671560 [marine sediment metagenome]|uniref:Glycosyltransferase 2-like domain-containing protein n=1 Tax=marine sediment metagenome TaxID=412755 RepID=A0A0F9IDL6_9ZZZZ
MRIRVHVVTYDRPAMLLRLLGDLGRSADPWHGDVEVEVFDDASPSDYAIVREFLRYRAWTFTRSSTNHGKHHHWKLITSAYATVEASEADLVVHMPDDVRLCKRFFHRAEAIWDGLDEPHKLAVNLLRDSLREGKSCWTSIVPTIADHIIYTGWVDGLFMAGRRYFELLNYRAVPVPAPFTASPQRGSGVYAYISEKLIDHGQFYCVKESLAVHVDSPSKMNRIERGRNPIRTLQFVDGDEEQQRLSKCACL